MLCLSGALSQLCFVSVGLFGPVVFWPSCVLAQLCFVLVVFWLSCALSQLCFVSVVLWLSCALAQLAVLWLSCALSQLCFGFWFSFVDVTSFVLFTAIAINIFTIC